MLTKTMYLYTETPLHAGAGSGLSSIDLPIQRERATQYPMIQGSGIKGKLRATLEGNPAISEDMINIVFGPLSTSGAGSDHAGALIAGDARLLLFPVRSLNGVFAYTTSYDVLSRFRRDIERIEAVDTLDWTVPDAVSDKALVTTKSDVHYNNAIVLEELSFVTESNKEVDKIARWLATNALPNMGAYWTNKLQTSLVILPNDVFRDFALYATEIITRVRIDPKKKTVVGGALWTEEHLPTDTLLYVPLYANKSRKEGLNKTEEEVLAQIVALNGKHIQLGGDETVGRGLVRIRLS